MEQDNPNNCSSNVALTVQQSCPITVDTNSIGPVDDPLYLLENAHCFKQVRELSNKTVKSKPKKNEKFQFTTQFLYGTYMPPYYSVLNVKLMEKLVSYLKQSSYNNNDTNENAFKSLLEYKEIIEHEQEFFSQWLSTIWEEKLKNRRLQVIPYIEDYVKSASNFSNSYIKSHYNGGYKPKMTIDYNREDIAINKVEMTYCQRIKAAEQKYAINLPKINITNLEAKVSFTDGVFNPPKKLPFVKDELCRTLSKEYSTEVNVCLSSLKHIMNLEKPNSVWLIPVNIEVDSDQHKKTYIGGALSTGHFSQQQKSWHYLRKQFKKNFRKPLSEVVNSETSQDYSVYNYDKWKLDIDGADVEANKTFNLLVRNKPHIQVKGKSNDKEMKEERVFMPKVEYQPEFGFEKISEDEFVEYWLDTYFRTPKSKLTLVSVQHNMDIMMIKQKNIESTNLEDKKQTYLQRLYLTLDKLTQLDAGEYVMLHNPKKPFQVELYQFSQYGGFNLLNMYFVLQQTEVSESLTWNTIDTQVVCPIHEHFKVAPCMFSPNPVILNIQMINEQVTKFRKNLEYKEKIEKERAAKRKIIKREKNKIKRKLERENDKLFKPECNE